MAVTTWSSTFATLGPRTVARIGRGARRATPGLLASAFLVLLLGVPLGMVIATSIGHPAGHAYASQLRSPTTRVILERTVTFALITTAVTVLVAFPVAYGLTLASPRLRRILFCLLVFPYLTSLLVRTYAWIGILGANGPVAAVAGWFGYSGVSFVGTGTGVLLVLVHVYLPYVILSSYVSMQRIDRSHLLASHSLGAPPLRGFWTVYAPQSLPGVVAGGVLVFVITVGMYAVPALIGGPNQTTLAMLVVQQVTNGYGLPQDVPAVEAVLLCVVVLIVLAVCSRAIGLSSLLGIAGNQGRSRKRRAAGRAPEAARRLIGRLAGQLPFQYSRRHLLVATATLAAIVMIDGPFVYLVGVSFQPLPLLTFPTHQVSARWYTNVLVDPMWRTAAIHSLEIALLATLIAVVIGTYLAILTTRGSRRLAVAIMTIALVPLVVPEILYATGIYTVFIKLHLIGNWIGIAAAHGALALPYAYINILNGLSAYDYRLDDAAHSLGASTSRRLWRITIPIIRPALLTGAFLAFLLSLDELLVSLFLAGITYKTLPLAFWAAANQNISPALAAVGVLLVIAVSLVGALAWQLTRRARTRARWVEGSQV